MQKLSRSKKSDIIKVGVLIAVMLLMAAGWYIWATRTANNEHSTVQQTTDTIVTLSGTVTARNNGCAHDSICTVSVDGRVIVTGGGLAADPNANIYGTADNDLRIGDKVRVKARTTDHGLTLQGCPDCYVTRGSIQR